MMLETSYRTHTCGQIDESLIGKKVKICGWINTKRSHKEIIFIDLRDRYGFVQCVISKKQNEELFKLLESLKQESVIQIEGTVKKRPEGTENEKWKSGKVEINIEKVEVLNSSDNLPLSLDKENTEEIRLRYRYLDLRTQKMQRNIIFRHKVTNLVREYFTENGFIEIETPLLGKPTPEGARDYIVPSRLHPGKFYALPQSPQLYKQLFMVSGFDRYFQIARCLRDEDLRADRQPEFTQIDVEMSFVKANDVMNIIDGLLKKLWKEIFGIEIETPIKKISWDDAMKYYGIDKPDLRVNLKLDEPEELNSKDVFCKVLPFAEKIEKNDIEEFKKEAKKLKFILLEEKEIETLKKKYKAETVLGVKGRIDQKDEINDFMAKVRVNLGKKYGYFKEGWEFVWVIDFPMFEYSKEEGRWVARHHPFTSIKEESLKDLDEGNFEKVKSNAYDIVLNGWEIGGGSIRIHKPEMQIKVLKLLGLNDKEIETKFGFLIEAFKFGAPPHGGIALGLDRLVALMLGEDSIREVLAFPKTKSAEDIMLKAPSEASEEQLKELHIQIVKEEKERKEKREEKEKTERKKKGRKENKK